MKIALAFFGLPRSSSITFPSVEQNLIAPLAALGELEVRYHLYRQRWVFNPRSGENHAQPEASYLPFLAYEGTLAEPPAQPSEQLSRLRSYGDAWQDDFHSLGNLLLQLQSLLAVTGQAAATAPDVVVFARPDLLYLDPLQAGDIERVLEHPDEILLPGWESWGGLNDRFAVCGARAYRAYGGRLLLADNYCGRTGRPLHAESFLRYALDFAAVPVRTIPMRATRVRVNGSMEDEDFEGLRSPLVK